MSKPSQSKRNKSLLFRLFLCFIIFVLLVIGGWESRRFFSYPTFFARIGIENWQVWEFHDYFQLDPKAFSVVINDQRLRDIENPPIIYEDEIFFPASFVREHIDPFIFWDEGAQTLFFSTDTEVIGLAGEDVLKHTVPMVSIAFLQELYPDFEIEYRGEFNIIIISQATGLTASHTPSHISTNHTFISTTAVTIRRTPIRYRPDQTAYITQQAFRGMPLTVFNFNSEYNLESDSEDGPQSDFVRVRTPEGLLGYVLTADLEVAATLNETLTPPESVPPSPNINLTWEMITAPQGNVTAMSTPLPSGLHVISPTWFYFDPETLEIQSFASHDYVEWAHSQSVAVWPRIFDTNHDISHRVLTQFEVRQQAIAQLIALVEEYNLDGINVNFEHIPRADGGYYVQFLRELAPEMRRIGAVLSVATFVPAPWFLQYNHELVGRTVDFVAIMTYDEHYRGSPEPGPVASLPFVERSIQNTLALIPREKVIMCLPFYNRLWRVTPDGYHTISNHGMARPWALIEEWGVTPVWDPIIGSYYASYTNDEGITYRIWVECERSIEEKLHIFTNHDLAGVASWRRGLETSGVWEVIDRAMP